ncbi:MAG: hypothetical protein J2P35_19145, partial [Actinobacteria bacterium]|nr:hypothetical protein [Actinomycetota bacterium]
MREYGGVSPGPLYRPEPGPPRRRGVVALIVAGVLVLVAAGGGISYLLLHTRGSPQQTAASYLRAWQRRDYRAMERVSVNVPAGGLAGPVGRAAAQLGMRRLQVSVGQVTKTGGTAQARFTATASLASGHAWTYQGQLRLVNRNRRWRVDWSPSAIYPGLRAGQRFV